MEYPASEPERAQESLQEAPAPFLPFSNGAGHFSQSPELLPFSKAAQPALELSLTSAVNIAGVNGTSAGYNGQEMGLSDQFSGLNGARTTFLQSPTNAPQPPKRSEGMQYLPPGPLGNGTDGRNMPLYSYSYTQNQTQGIGFAGGAPQLRRGPYSFSTANIRPPDMNGALSSNTVENDVAQECNDKENRMDCDNGEGPARFTCDFCHQTIGRPYDLKRHIIAIHGSQKFFCRVESCKRYESSGIVKHFNRKDKRNEHERRVHNRNIR